GAGHGKDGHAEPCPAIGKRRVAISIFDQRSVRSKAGRGIARPAGSLRGNAASELPPISASGAEMHDAVITRKTCAVRVIPHAGVPRESSAGELERTDV